MFWVIGLLGFQLSTQRDMIGDEIDDPPKDFDNFFFLEKKKDKTIESKWPRFSTK